VDRPTNRADFAAEVVALTAPVEDAMCRAPNNKSVARADFAAQAEAVAELNPARAQVQKRSAEPAQTKIAANREQEEALLPGPERVAAWAGKKDWARRDRVRSVASERVNV